MPATLTRVSTGKIFDDQFASLSSWSYQGSTYSVTTTRPKFVFRPTPMPLIAPDHPLIGGAAPGGTTANQNGGVREARVIVEPNGNWDILAAGCGGVLPGNTNSAIGWQPMAFNSSDRGITVNVLGPILPHLVDGTQSPVYYASDLGMSAVKYTDGKWYISIVESATAATVPGLPYYNADYSSADFLGINSAYTLYGSNLNPALGSNGTHTSQELVRSTTVYNPGGGYYEGWFSCADAGTPSATPYNANRIVSASTADPRGPWNNSGTNLLLHPNVCNCVSNLGACENPMFLGGLGGPSTPLVTYGGKYMLVGNNIRGSGLSTLALWTADPASGSDSFANFNNSSNPHVVDLTNGIYGVPGGGIFYSTIAPFQNASNGVVTVADGGIPVVYSVNPSQVSATGHWVYGGKLEPAFSQIQYTDTGATSYWLLRPGPAATSNFVFEYVYEIQDNTDSGAMAAAWCLANPSTADAGQTAFMSIRFPGSQLSGTTDFEALYNISAGSLSTARNGTSGAVNIPKRPVNASTQASYLNRYRIVHNYSGGTHTNQVSVDDAAYSQLLNTSADPGTLGSYIGFRVGTIVGGIVRATCYTSPALTISNLPSGTMVALRMAGVLVNLTNANSAGVATLTATHWPCDGIEIGGSGVDLTPQDSDPHWWGGDVLNYVPAATGASSQSTSTGNTITSGSAKAVSTGNAIGTSSVTISTGNSALGN